MSSDPTQYTRRVKRIRTASLTLAALLAGILVLWSGFQSGNWFDTDSPTGPAQAALKDAVLRGKNAQGQPYILRAQILRRQIGDAEIFDMIEPDMTLGSPSQADTTRVQSQTGTYNQRSGLAVLSGEAQVYKGQDTTITAPNIEFNTATGDLLVEGPLVMTSPTQTIKAAGLKSSNLQKRYDFSDAVITLRRQGQR
jgi:LPS export ABC transporter protein LptC